MEKPAETQYPIEEILRRRWSPRAFSDRLVEPEKLQSLFEAARWAASSFNEQPWNFIVATKRNPEDHARLLGCLVEGNQRWAHAAPVLMVSVAKLNFDKTGKPNRHAFHDVGLAVQNMIIEATALGLCVHQMAGFSSQKVREIYGVPDGFEPVAAIAIGYGLAADELPEAFREFELGARRRKPVSSFVFEAHWGNTSRFVSE
jgi:nitroreductase